MNEALCALVDAAAASDPDIAPFIDAYMQPVQPQPVSA
jgi:hypothetical protein